MALVDFYNSHGLELKEQAPFGKSLYVITNQIKAGTIIFKERALSYALNQSVCHYCWKPPNVGEQLYRCGNCKFGRYCSKLCQTNDWKQCHKIRCKAISSLNGNKLPTPTVISIAELLINIQPSCTKNIKSLHQIQLSLMNSLKHHFDKKTDDEITEINQISICIALYMKSLHQIIQKRKTNSKNQSLNTHGQWKLNMKQINLMVSKYQTNGISIYDDEFNTFGIGLFPLLSMLNHSCNPNVLIHFNRTSKCAEVRALRDINKNEQLFISYTDVTVPKFQRQKTLFRDYYFKCKCSFCVNSVRSSLETKCIQLCCSKCLYTLNGSNYADIYQCINTKCNQKYNKNDLRKIIDETELKYLEIKQNANSKFVRNKAINLLKECNVCLLNVDRIVGEYHWLRISLLKIKEKLEMNLNDFVNCYESNKLILEFYKIWLSNYSPYLGLQYCLTGKLLNYLIVDKCNDVYSVKKKLKNKNKMKELHDLCVEACDLFQKGIHILMTSHGETDFIKTLLECYQTAQFNLQNVKKQ